MKLKRTTLRNIGRFEDASIDLGELGSTDRIVVFDGVTGAGKSTVVEALTGGALFREFRNSGDLTAMASGREASLHTVIEHDGIEFEARHTIDDRNGESVLSSGAFAYNADAKKTSFDAKVAELLPPEPLLYNTIWREQEGRGFLQMKESERRKLILLATGATKWEAYAKRARDRAKEAENQANVVRRTLVAIPDPNLLELSEAVTLQRERVELTAKHLRTTQTDLDVARQSAGDSAVARLAYEDACAKLRDLQRRIREADDRRTAIDSRIAATQQLLSEAEKIGDACARKESNVAKLTELHGEYVQVRAELRAANESKERISDQLTAAAAKREQCLRVLETAASVDVAVESLPRLREEHSATESRVLTKRKEYEQLGNAQVADKDGRIEQLRDALITIEHEADTREAMSPTQVQRIQYAAQDALNRDNVQRNLAETIPQKLIDAKRSIEAAEANEKRARAALAAAEREAARADEIARARVELDDLSGSLERMRLEYDQEASKATDLSVRLEQVTREGKLLAAENEQLAPTVALATALATAQAQLDELQPQAERLSAELANLRAERERLPEPTAPEQGPDHSAVERRLKAAQEAHTAAAAALGAAEERARQGVTATERRGALEAELRAAEQQASEWTRLALDLGSDGIQAALVDAAGPELTEVANHLLHTCFGSRWSLQVTTQRQSANGKKTIEECEVRVIDEGDEAEHAPPRTGEGRTFSGGEKGILNDALFFALTHLSRNAGIVNPDLVIDEWGANLNEERRARWVRMLRMAADIIGAEHVYVVTHNEDIKALADARVVVARGTVRIEH